MLVYSYIHVCVIVCAPVYVLLMVAYNSRTVSSSLLLICLNVNVCFSDIPVENKTGGQTNDASKENWP